MASPLTPVATAQNAGTTGPVVAYAGSADLTPVVQALRRYQNKILERWLARVTGEPFHLGRRERAISDHIPALLEALLQSLSDDAPAHRAVHSTMDSEAVQKAASQHAQARRTQGLSVTEVIGEVRVLRQETSRALLEDLDDGVPAAGILAAELALNDGFDGAICIAADTVVAGIEQDHRDALAITVHDLKSPLGAVKLSAYAALRRSKAPDIDKFLNRIVDCSNRVRAIVDEALAALRAADGDQLHPTAVPVEQFLQDAVSALGAEARLRIAITVADDVPRHVVWDIQRLRRTFENVVSNALKYAPEGPIDIAAHAAPDDQLLITVKDRGIGLSADDKRKLFARYYRSPEAIRLKIEGTGLGMYVAKATIQAQGGKLHVQSAGPGKGTTVQILLPVNAGGGRTAQ